MSKVIVGSNLIVAFLDEKDSHRAETLRIWSEMEKLGFKVRYLDCVLNETLSVLCRRCSERKRLEEFPDVMERFRAHFPSDRITWVYPKNCGSVTSIMTNRQKTHQNAHFC